MEREHFKFEEEGIELVVLSPICSNNQLNKRLYSRGQCCTILCGRHKGSTKICFKVSIKVFSRKPKIPIL